MRLAKVLPLCCLALILFLNPCLAADGGMAEHFRYSADLIAPEGQNYTSVRLTPEIVGKSKGDLSDLLLVSRGRTVPYFINSYSIAKSSSVTVYEMSLSDSYVKDSFQYLDYELSSEPSGDILATSVNLEAPGQFVKDIELYGSYDGMHWDFVGSYSIFQVEGSRKLSVPLLPGKKYTWYRFRVSGNQEPVSLRRVFLEYSLDIVSKNAFEEAFTPAMTVREDGSLTVISLHGLKNLALSEIKIETDSMFKRAVSVNGRSHTLYNLVFGSGRYSALTIPMDGYQSPSDILELQIDNGDDSPIDVNSVSVSYLACDLVFQNTGAPVTLYFGNGGALEPPRYDIMHYKKLILEEGYGKAEIGEITERPAEPPKEPETPDYTMLFNAAIVAAAVLLAALLIVRIKRVK